MRLLTSDEVASRFWTRTKVDQETGCRLWTGPLTDKGYGRVKIGGRFCRANRVAFDLAIGPIPDGLFVCHRCDVRACVEPAHLFLGTAAENNQDCVNKGRRAPPDGPAFRALDPRIAASIREYSSSGATMTAIASRLGVSPTTVLRVVRGSRMAIAARS